MGVKVGINGFGRIGRNVFRRAYLDPDIEIMAINDLAPAASLANLLKYDSVHGVLDEDISVDGNTLIVGGEEFIVLAEKDPGSLPWSSMGVEVAIESTGFFTKRDGAARHLDAGAKKVIISAPSDDPDVTMVLGVNDYMYDKDKDNIISNASCTTNGLAPVSKVIMENFGIARGFMTTCHAYTNDQNTLDLYHKDPRRARAAALSIIPTSTGAAYAIGLVIPELEGKFDGVALRVPTPDGSLVDLVVETIKETTTEEVNAAMKKAAESQMKGILQYSEDPLVSIDIVGNLHSSVFDAPLTMVNGTTVKVFAWYDNEMAYSQRVVDLIKFIVK